MQIKIGELIKSKWKIRKVKINYGNILTGCGVIIIVTVSKKS